MSGFFSISHAALEAGFILISDWLSPLGGIYTFQKQLGFITKGEPLERERCFNLHLNYKATATKKDCGST